MTPESGACRGIEGKNGGRVPIIQVHDPIDNAYNTSGSIIPEQRTVAGIDGIYVVRTLDVDDPIDDG